MSITKLSQYSNTIPLFNDFPKDILNLISEYLDEMTFVVLMFVSRRGISESFLERIPNISYYGVLYGNIRFMEWGTSMGHPCTPETFDVAIQKGNIEIVEFVFSKINISVKSSHYCNLAAKYGHLQVLKCLRKWGFNLHSIDVSIKAACGGYLDILEWLETDVEYRIRTPDCVNVAARKGHLKVLEFLREKNYPFSCGASFASAGGGQIKVLEWLQINGYDINRQVADAAADNGHVDVLIWLRENGHAMYPSLLIKAVRGGHLKVLQWLWEYGCPLDPYLTVVAAKEGDATILEWLHKNGCPWNEAVAKLQYTKTTGYY